MASFGNRPLILYSIPGFEFPPAIAQDLQNGDYENAVKNILDPNSSKNIVDPKYKCSFNNVVRCLSNCPEALTEYLYQRANRLTTYPTADQVIGHLYVQQELNYISTLRTSARATVVKGEAAEQADKPSGRLTRDAREKRLVEFITIHKQALDTPTVLKWAKCTANINLIYSIALALGDYVTAYQYTNGNDLLILHCAPNLPPELQRQAYLQVFRKNAANFKNHVADLENKNVSVLFDSLVDLVMQTANFLESGSATNRENAVQSKILMIDLYRDGFFKEQVYLHLYFIILCYFYKYENDDDAGDVEVDYSKSKKGEPVDKHYQVGHRYRTFLRSQDFQKLDIDFIGNYLIQNDMYIQAADSYSYFSNRHIAAIQNSLREGKKLLLSIFKRWKKMKIPDLKKCWIRAFRLAAPIISVDQVKKNIISGLAISMAKLNTLLTGQATEQEQPKQNANALTWGDLISEAHKSGTVTLDEILPLLPESVDLTRITMYIGQAVTSSSEANNRSINKREQIESRAAIQRNEIIKPDLPTDEIDPANAICSICGQNVCDGPFDYYPTCGHFVHMNCYLANMHTYFDTATRLRLISLANITRQDPENYSNLASILSQSCPACGAISLNILDQPFFVPGEEDEDIEAWEVPYRSAV